MEEESCNLPNPCDCWQCQWWADNSCDMSRTEDWQVERWRSEDSNDD